MMITVDFGQPILDLQDKPVQEIKPNDQGQFVPSRIIPTRFRHPQEAQMAGEPTGNLHPSEDGTHLVRHEYDVLKITLLHIARSAINTAWPGDEAKPADEIYERFDIAKRLRHAEARGKDLRVELDEKEVATVRACTDNMRGQSVLYFARARELLDAAVESSRAEAKTKRHTRSN